MRKGFVLTAIIFTVLVIGTVIFLRSNRSEPVELSVEQELEKELQNANMVEAKHQAATSTETSPTKGTEVSKDLEESFKELPTMTDMKSLTEEEVHHTPEAVIEGGRIIGRLLERAEKDPARREDTVKFLLKCAESDEVVTAVRAVCWKNTMSQIKNWKVFVPIGQAEIPTRVRELSAQLP